MSWIKRAKSDGALIERGETHGNLTRVYDIHGLKSEITRISDIHTSTINYVNGVKVSRTETHINPDGKEVSITYDIPQPKTPQRTNVNTNRSTSNTKLPPCMALMGRTISATPNRKKK